MASDGKRFAAAALAAFLVWGALQDRWTIDAGERSTPRTDLDDAFDIGYITGHCQAIHAAAHERDAVDHDDDVDEELLACLEPARELAGEFLQRNGFHGWP